MSNEQYFVYLNRYGEVKPYRLRVDYEGDDYLEVYDYDEKKSKTFKINNILSTEKSYEEAQLEASVQQNDYEYKPPVRTPSRDNWNNKEEKFEVCFTGFTASDKSELNKIAEENGMFVRKGITQNLGLLVCGYNAGPKKMQEANKNDIPRVVGLEGFINFIETGEFAE